MSSQANKYGYGVFTAILRENDSSGDFIPDFLVSRNVAGVIFLSNIPDNIKTYLDDERIPYVFADIKGEEPSVNCLTIDYRNAMNSLLSHLLSCGYTKYFIVSNQDKPYPNYFLQELDCFREFLSENNLDGEVLPGRENKLSVLKKVDEEIKNATPETVFIADSRYFTIKLLEFFYAHGKSIPRDAGFVGNHIIADFTEPKLTTKKISFYNVGEVSVDMMDNIWKNKNKPIKNVVLQCQIIKNDSTQRTGNDNI